MPTSRSGVVKPLYHRTVAEVDLARLRANFKALYALQKKYGAPPKHAPASASQQGGLIAMIKANGYGHGLLPVARALQGEPGLVGYGVATLDEAMQLREGGVKERILVCTDALPLTAEMETLLEQHALTPVIHRPEDLKTALKSNRKYCFHAKINTGLNRLGLDLDEFAASEDALRTAAASGRFEGLFTHLASPDAPQSALTKRQVGRFKAVLSILGTDVPQFIHAAATRGLIEAKALELDGICNVARPGIGLYGYGGGHSNSPSPSTLNLSPVLTWKARVLKVRKLDAGEKVGYAGTYTAKKAMTQAVIAVGYGDGMGRLHSNGELGGRAIMGRVSMDLTVIEGKGLKCGDWFTILGDQPHQAEGLATQGQTIVYEILTALSHRVPRVYYAGQVAGGPATNKQKDGG